MVYRFCRFIACVAVIAASVAATAPARAQAPGDAGRVALVIGNGAYAHVDRLANPGHDATLIADALRRDGFALIGGGAQKDVDRARFTRLVQEFGQHIQGADVALFYYAGHGLQLHESNWLLPVDASLAQVQDVDAQMIDAAAVLKQMDRAGTRLNIVILDACRDNPFAGPGARGLGGGLAQMQAPDGTLISFATQPGNVAADGSGANGPYAMALVAAMRQPGLDIFRLFNQVGLRVKQTTQGKQQPWVSTSPIDGEFFFAGGDAAPDSGDAATLGSVPPSRVSAAHPPVAPDHVHSLRLLADKGQPEAQTDLGLLLSRGIGVPKDYAAGLALFERAAAQGSSRAEYYAGVMHERGYGVERSYAVALDFYRRAAAQNFTLAQIAIARFYGRGLGVSRDPDERTRWLLRAAARESPTAQYILGNIYRRGTDVPKDAAAAAGWYRKAASHDYAKAQVQLALLYEHGNGVPQDYAEAMRLMGAAAAARNAEAQNAIGVFYDHGWSVPQDYAQAIAWYRLAAAQGNAAAEFNLGRHYAAGLGVPRDLAEARKWFEQAAARGDEMAIARLARLQAVGGHAAPAPTGAGGGNEVPGVE